MGINYAPIINEINHLSEKGSIYILCSKNNKIVTDIHLKSLATKKR